jgi:hypothetical protein
MNPSTNAAHLTERRFAAFDRFTGIALVALGGACFVVSLLEFASHVAGNLVHPDAVLIPLAAGIVLAGAGSFFLLAASAMRRHAAKRWTVQWSALLAPLLLALFVALSQL